MVYTHIFTLFGINHDLSYRNINVYIFLLCMGNSTKTSTVSDNPVFAISANIIKQIDMYSDLNNNFDQ